MNDFWKPKTSTFVIPLFCLLSSCISSSVQAFSLSSSIRKHFPCIALSLLDSSWQSSYFEPTLLPPSQQEGNTSVEARVLEAGLVNFTCDSPVGTTHVFRCNPNGFSFEPTSKKIKATILFLHGFLTPLQAAIYVPILSAILTSFPPLYESVRLEVPLAPLRIITVNGLSITNETAFRAWIDISASGSDRLSLYRASQRVERLALSQACSSRHPLEKVLLIGHSLGAFTALEFALSTDVHLAGVIPISGVLPRIADYALPPEFRPFNVAQRNYNITMIHGTADETVPFSAAMASAQVLEPLSRLLGFGYELVPLQGLDHADTLVRSPLFFAAINKAVAQALSLDYRNESNK